MAARSDRESTPPESAIAWASGVLGSPVRSVRVLTGGMDSAIHVLVPERGEPVVMRRYVGRSREAGAALAKRESDVLRALAATDVAAPAFIANDLDGEHCDAPGLLVEFMDGRRDIPRDLRTLASELARTMAAVHEVSASDVDELPDEIEVVAGALAAECPDLHGSATSAAMWSLVRDRPRRPSGTGPRILIHNDFAPHNTLFNGDRLCAVVDWTATAAGVPACDVSFCRLNVALVLGLEAGTEVLRAYEAEIGAPLPDHGWWDLVAAARVEPDLSYWTQSANYFGPPGLTAKDVADRFARFVRTALQTS
jgi:aminoglycoside phosphotransferase (APT) family kinase protein